MWENANDLECQSPEFYVAVAEKLDWTLKDNAAPEDNQQE